MSVQDLYVSSCELAQTDRGRSLRLKHFAEEVSLCLRLADLQAARSMESLAEAPRRPHGHRERAHLRDPQDGVRHRLEIVLN